MNEHVSLHLEPKSAYVHIPFCLSKCNYCDFFSVAGSEAFYEDYTRALVSEIINTQPKRSLSTVYFGGGTPTCLAPCQLATILDAVRRHIGVDDDAEITVEVNPETIDADIARELLSSGFNRVSLGVQSFDDGLLLTMGRAHGSARAMQAIDDMRRAGFRNLGIDLIFAVPGQSVSGMRNDLNKAMELLPQHISLYELTIEKDTPFYESLLLGEISPLSEDTRTEMYEEACAILENKYHHYEVSNFALAGYESRHNINYWKNGAYYGFGAGATGYVDRVRYQNAEDVSRYIKDITNRGCAVATSEMVTGIEHACETLMLGLRMTAGVSLHHIARITGIDVRNVYRLNIDRLVTGGLLELDDDIMRATNKGLLVLDSVIAELCK